MKEDRSDANSEKQAAAQWLKDHPYPAPNATDQALWIDAWRTSLGIGRSA